ncbi:MAG: hypothetical protein ACKN89_13815 [Cyanobium sp.]|nr:hypothetical protein [Synechococcaceae cyanobacterium]
MQPIAVDLLGLVRFPQPALPESDGERIEDGPNPNPLLALPGRASLKIRTCSPSVFNKLITERSR